MDAYFKIPKIPLVTATTATISQKPSAKPLACDDHQRRIKSETTKKTKNLSKVSTKSKLEDINSSPIEPASIETNGGVLSKKSKNQFEQTKTRKKVDSETIPHRNVSDNLLPLPQALPQLCESCSQILREYLEPLEAYVKQIIHLTNAQIPAKSSIHSHQRAQRDTTEKQANSSNVSSIIGSDEARMEVKTQDYADQPITQWLYNAVDSDANQRSSLHTLSSNHRNHPHHIETRSTNEFPSEIIQNFSLNNPQHRHIHDDNSEIKSSAVKQDQLLNYESEGERQTNLDWQEQHLNLSKAPLNSNQIPLTGATAGPQQNEDKQALSETEVRNCEKNQNEPTFRGDKNESVINFEQDRRSSTDSQSSHNEFWFSESVTIENEVPIHKSPYAYVTIAYDNLSALNAILLANSIQLYNNKVLNVLNPSGKKDSQYKSISTLFHIPTFILVYDTINAQLLDIIYQVFDKVIESHCQDTVLLNDESLGIHQFKLHLWKELAFQCEICIFLESFTMVVGQISNLFLECRELSASVDCQFTDNFNCSVFVFEPNLDTFKALLQYGLKLKLMEAENENAFEFDTLDEMMLLNQFFNHKWNKLSFIYNFVRNDLTYTQVPAYFKFGGNIRVVNFGNTVGQHSFYSGLQSTTTNGTSEQLNSPTQPWNYKFDLNKASLDDEPFQDAPIDNYCKFYLCCFMRRVWPLLSQTITPLLLSKNSQSLVSISDLLQMLGNGLRSDGSKFSQNLGTLRRRKSWVAEPNLSQLEITSPNDDESQQSPEIVCQDDAESRHLTSENDDQEIGGKIEENENYKTTEMNDMDEEKMFAMKQQLNEESKRQWEDGRIDWMGDYQSDKIINRLKNIIRK